MSAIAFTPTLQQPLGGQALRTNWIISRRDDLTWFIGPALVSYLALGLIAAGFPITLLYLLWFVGVDGPHVIATTTRTYFDKQERHRLGRFLWIVVPLVLAGPVMVWAGQAALFYFFAVCWQHYHIAKQHFGFVMMWKAKNKERDPIDFKLDRWFLLASTILPLAIFMIKTGFSNWAVLGQIGTVAIGIYLVFVAVYVGRQVQKFRRRLPMNPPKLLLLSVLVPLQWIAFLDAAGAGPNGILRAGIALGLFHSFQYHRLLWFHNKNRYSAPGASERHGLAVFFAKDFGYYIFTAIGLHLLFNTLPQTLFPAVEWIKAAIWGIPFTHYMLDSRIWRVRGDKELAAALRF